MSNARIFIVGLDGIAVIWCTIALFANSGRGVLMAGGAIAALWLFVRFNPLTNDRAKRP